MLKPSAKLWLKRGKVSVMGEGRARLLLAVEEHGSITKAAQTMSMSYRHAWGILRHISDTAGGKVVITTRGGAQGGGARLTELGKQILEQYKENAKLIEKLLKYGPRPALAVDGVIFDKDGNLVLIRRKNPPFQHKLALPGGFVENNETTEQAVIREVREELGIETKIDRLVGVYSEPSRDPRAHVISIVYKLEPLSYAFKAGDDAAEFEIIPCREITKIKDMAFDHGKIIADIIDDQKKH